MDENGTILVAAGMMIGVQALILPLRNSTPDGNVEAMETGSHTWENYEGVEETRSFEFKYDADYNLIEGTETHGDGTRLFAPIGKSSVKNVLLI